MGGLPRGWGDRGVDRAAGDGSFESADGRARVDADVRYLRERPEQRLASLQHRRPGDRAWRRGRFRLGWRAERVSLRHDPHGRDRRAVRRVSQGLRDRSSRQSGAFDAVRPGVPCEDVDRAARDVITDAGYGEYFIHRVGHGLGLDVHEDPYMVKGNKLPLAPGMTFSDEPGIYMPGKFGIRIEDTVVCTQDCFVLINGAPRDLTVMD